MDAAGDAGEKLLSGRGRTEIDRSPAPYKLDTSNGYGGDDGAEDTVRPHHMPLSGSSAPPPPPQRKKSRRRQRRASRRLKDDRFLYDVLDSVDTNVLAAPKEVNGAPGSEHSSYAEAVKDGPVDKKADAVKEDDERPQNPDETQTNGSTEVASEKLKKSEKTESDIAGMGATSADVIKYGATKTERTNGHTSDGSRGASGKKAEGCKIDYPELREDAAIHEEETERLRDRVAAPQVGGIRFAPLKVPLKRRMQTLAVLFHSLCMGTTVSMFFFLCALPFLWPIIIIYLITILFATDAADGRLRRRKEWFRRSMIWKYFAEYFPAKLHKTHDLPPTRKYIFGYHPHGIISHGAWVAFASEALGFAEKFPGITNSLLTLDSNFRTPIYREYVFSMGCLSVSKESITNTLTKGGPNGEGMGRAVTIVIGGARESLEAQPGRMKLILKERKGFIKLAIRTGADLVPVVAFGENELYDQLQPHEHPFLHRIQRHFLKVWKFTVPLLHGRGIFNYDVGLMPYRRPMNIVVGKPINVVQNANPGVEEVDRLHDLYTEEVQKVWDRYKDDFAKDRKEELQILE